MISKPRIAVVGGDDRELIVSRELLAQGYPVNIFGFPVHLVPDKVCVCPTIWEAVQNAQVIIFPLPGIRNNGVLFAKYIPEEIRVTREDLAPISPDSCIFVGKASPYLKSLAQALTLEIQEIAELDSVAVPNAVPTSEGAIQLAMEKMPVTIHGSSAFILGFGRVAEVLAFQLKGLGARVTVAARNPGQRAKCSAFSYRALSLKELSGHIKNADVVFNTIPAQVLGEEVLINVKKGTLIIDLASSPGGTDFNAALRLGIQAVLALGLPGKVAPVTAGKILAGIYPELIAARDGLRNR